MQKSEGKRNNAKRKHLEGGFRDKYTGVGYKNVHACVKKLQFQYCMFAMSTEYQKYGTAELVATKGGSHSYPVDLHY